MWTGGDKLHLEICVSMVCTVWGVNRLYMDKNLEKEVGTLTRRASDAHL